MLQILRTWGAEKGGHEKFGDPFEKFKLPRGERKKCWLYKAEERSSRNVFCIGIAHVDSRKRSFSQNVENPQSGVFENNAHLSFSILRRRPPFPPEYNVGSRRRRAGHRSSCASKNKRLFRKADSVFSSPNIGCGGSGGKIVTKKESSSFCYRTDERYF